MMIMKQYILSDFYLIKKNFFWPAEGNLVLMKWGKMRRTKEVDGRGKNINKYIIIRLH